MIIIKGRKSVHVELAATTLRVSDVTGYEYLHHYSEP